MLGKAVDESDDASGAGKDGAPLLVRQVGRALLAADDLGAMFWKLDLLAMTKGAGMLGNDGGTIEQSDSAVVGDQWPSGATVIWCRTLIIRRARWSDSPSIDGVETICERALRFAHLARGRAE
jgi:hypothetical protein